MSFELKTIELSGGRLSYHVGGTGQPVVYLHAAGGVMLTEPLKALTGKPHGLCADLPGLRRHRGRTKA
jgi:hypothetical protein